MNGDRIFDESLAGKFGQRIYGSYKGVLRQHLLLRDLTPLLSTPTRVLDIGGGQGDMTLLLAQMGHQLTFTEPSAPMRQEAQKRFLAAGLDIGVSDQPLQALDGQYPLVIFHAVLEWLAEQPQALAQALARVAPGGHLSLLFYNRHSIDFNHLIRGNFGHLSRGRYGGGKSLTPPQPLWPEEVADWLAAQPVEVLVKTGIRCFSDYFQKGQHEPDLATRIHWEEKVANRDPYRALARYQHWLIHKLPAPASSQ
ncbi:methyltransferase domain-containing protein [Gallaecimonas sp. GXIMD1310]|uniref:methyltransferase domain-containing protein n=1 Tax=Gallaecimonas sp. GXIMD1310 TaxID=3131926 RepID=UPI00324835AB